MVRPLLLDLYCCQGGAGMGYHDLGFDIVGVDVVPQPRYPFPIVIMDALEFARRLLTGGRVGGYVLSDFVGVHASPPCQRYSDTQRIQDNEHPDLITFTRELCIAMGLPYVIENVPGARQDLINPIELCGAMFPPLRVYRHRLFECSFSITAPPHPTHVAPQVKMGRPPRLGEWVQAVGNFSGVDEARAAMQMPWASREGLREAIPPAYTRYVGAALMEHVQMREAA